MPFTITTTISQKLQRMIKNSEVLQGDNFLKFSFLLKHFYRVVLISAVQQGNSIIHLHFFLCSFPLWFISGYRMWFPMLSSRILLFIHFMYDSLHLLIPNQSIPLPPLSPLVTTVCFLSMSLLLFCRQVHLCHVLESTYKVILHGICPSDLFNLV